MGLCESCCPQNSENSEQEDAYGDRSRLIGHPESGIPGRDSAENDHDATYNDEGKLDFTCCFFNFWKSSNLILCVE
jgi:hypothetical protein